MAEEHIKTYPGRKSQIDLLHNLYKDGPFPDSVFVYGISGVGKSTVVTSVLSSCDANYALVNLIECYTPKILFESILNKLWQYQTDPNANKTFTRCDNMMEFVTILNEFCEIIDMRRAVIVLDKAEQLRNMDFTLLAAFLRLRELCGIKVSVLFISVLSFQKYYTRTNFVEPIKIYFPQYNRDELSGILNLDQDGVLESVRSSPNGDLVDVEVLANFVNVLMSSFYRACRDLVELKSMLRINFPIYCKPILDGITDPTSSVILWKHIAPTLKKSLENLYLRISKKNENIVEVENLCTGNIALPLELPFYAKFLLIAAYLASYNPAKEDKKLFMKYHGKKKKRMADVKAKSKVSEQLNTQLGPKSFSFDRLIAIFYAILDNKVNFNDNLLVQISTLVELQLLTSTSDNCNLGGQKYKCAVSLHFIQNISKMVGFNIRKYLIDFSHM